MRFASPRSCAAIPAGAKAVESSGATLDELLNNLDAAHGGLRERLVDGEKLRRFVNVYLNDEDVRFLGGPGDPRQGRSDTVTVSPGRGRSELLIGAPDGKNRNLMGCADQPISRGDAPPYPPRTKTHPD